MSGIRTKATSIGAQFHKSVGAITIDDNMRWTKMSGSFTAPFSNVGTAAGIVGSDLRIFDGTNIVAGADAGRIYGTVGSIRYASGPKAGQVYAGTYVDNNTNVRTNIRDLGSFANDLALSGKFEGGFADITARAGFFYMNQKIVMDWHTNKSLREVSGDNPAQLDLYSPAGAKLTQEGISGYKQQLG